MSPNFGNNYLRIPKSNENNLTSWSTFKTFNLCQVSDNRYCQSCLQLSFPPLVCLSQAELYYSPLIMCPHILRNVNPPHLPFFLQWFFQLLYSIDAPFRATKILSKMGLDISFNCSFWSYQNPINSGSWHFCQQ